MCLELIKLTFLTAVKIKPPPEKSPLVNNIFTAIRESIGVEKSS
jgi:hypothetical protein